MPAEPPGILGICTQGPPASGSQHKNNSSEVMNMPLAKAVPDSLLDPMETASIDHLRQHQLERLRWSLKHAYNNVPLYRQRFDAAGVHPDDIRDLANRP
jgi:phenylacetate-coenzyme A ligase PaaK-like adenylate-forming protein